MANLLYRFSVVLLELLTGQTSISKPKINNSGEDFLEWNGRELKRSEDIINVMDKQLEGQYTPKSAEVAASLAYDAGLGNDPKKSTIETVVKRLELLEKLNLAFADLKSSSGRCISNEHHGDAWGK
ncbi:hypothetical protein MKX03_005346 [Papaver bracteatum]|nr:hypothetical protein MKX03_005346 [Papaver bracteatum]